jgi:putative transposase
MPRRPRPRQPGLVFHVLNRGARKGGLFANPGDYQAFEAILLEGTRRFGIALFAYCLMPNHWHFLLSPTRDGSLSRFMHWLTFTHARRWRHVHGTGGQGAVYQDRFKAIPISTDSHFIWVCRYVERNALRASLVDRAEEWPWSSLWQRQNNRHADWLSTWPVAVPTDWVDIVNEPQTDSELAAFRHAVSRGHPFGDATWTATTARDLGLTLRRRGRPKMVPGVISR